jgi:signal transduction histidine kinase
MTVRSRLVLTLTVLGLVLALPSFYGLNRLTELRNIALELRGRHAEAADAVKRVQIALGELDRNARSYIVAPNSASRAAMWKALNRAEVAMDQLWDAGYGEESASIAARLAELEAATLHTEALIEAGRPADATADFQRTKRVLGRANESLDPLVAAIDRASAGAAVRAQEISASAEQTIWGFSMASIVLAALLGAWMTRGLTSPIHRLKLAMAHVAEGEFETPEDLPYQSPDELGDLSRSFRSMTKQLAELQRLRAEFVSIASHELKTPLNVIGGYAEILEEGQFGEMTAEQNASLRMISDQVNLLSGLVNRLLDMGRYEAGAFHLQMEPVHVGDLMTGVSIAFEALARTQQIDFIVQVQPSAPDTVHGDMDRLRNEVCGNLLSNAFKFTPRGGQITVRVGGTDECLRVEVQDTGEGIPPDQLSRVFDKFFQHRSRARAQGAGLGLAIARDIVEAHGGTIGVASEVGVGTTFWFTVPIGQVAREVPRMASAARLEIVAGDYSRA